MLQVFQLASTTLTMEKLPTLHAYLCRQNTTIIWLLTRGTTYMELNMRQGQTSLAIYRIKTIHVQDAMLRKEQPPL